MLCKCKEGRTFRDIFCGARDLWRQKILGRIVHCPMRNGIRVYCENLTNKDLVFASQKLHYHYVEISVDIL